MDTSQPLQLTLSMVKAKLREINPTIIILAEDYDNSHAPLACKCRMCGHKWSPMWTSLQCGRGCPKCGFTKMRNKLGSSLANVQAKLLQINPGIVIKSKQYRNNYSPIVCKCQKCKHVWSSRWRYLVAGHGCPNCGQINSHNKARAKLSEIRKQLAKIDGSIEITGPYVNTHTPIKCLCKKCGKVWYPTWKNLRCGHGCPKCSGSKSEAETRVMFEKVTDLKWPPAKPSEVPFLHGLYLDGYCRELKSLKFPGGTAFEYQGKHHYEVCNFNGYKDTESDLRKRKRKDRRKRIQCWRHGVRLIRIPYWVKSNNLKQYICNKLRIAGQ